MKKVIFVVTVMLLGVTACFAAEPLSQWQTIMNKTEKLWEDNKFPDAKYELKKADAVIDSVLETAVSERKEAWRSLQMTHAALIDYNSWVMKMSLIKEVFDEIEKIDEASVAVANAKDTIRSEFLMMGGDIDLAQMMVDMNDASIEEITAIKDSVGKYSAKLKPLIKKKEGMSEAFDKALMKWIKSPADGRKAVNGIYSEYDIPVYSPAVQSKDNAGLTGIKAEVNEEWDTVFEKIRLFVRENGETGFKRYIGKAADIVEKYKGRAESDEDKQYLQGLEYLTQALRNLYAIGLEIMSLQEAYEKIEDGDIQQTGKLLARLKKTKVLFEETLTHLNAADGKIKCSSGDHASIVQKECGNFQKSMQEFYDGPFNEMLQKLLEKIKVVK